MEARADPLVLFGATGDLVRKKLIPAIYELAAAGKLGIPVIGVARSDWDDERLRTHTRDVLNKYKTLDETVFTDIATNLTMVVGDYNDPETYRTLADRLTATTAPCSTSPSRRRSSKASSTDRPPSGERNAAASSSRNPSVGTGHPLVKLKNCLATAFAQPASSASTTISAKKRSKDSWSSASPTPSWSRCGTADTFPVFG